ncbi:MAG: glutamate racemase [Christensenellaceae bacterium]|nr:glutamate racemase [Christensenellaceae bacterium]
MSKNPIGIFDSGMGGVSVLAEATRFLPYENFIYIGDTAFAPYGVKPTSLILNRSLLISEKLIGEGCKAILIACNTASSVAAKYLRSKYSLPIIAMEPALKPAYFLSSGKTVLVLATNITLKLEKFKLLMKKYGANAEPIPCPDLVMYVENLNFDKTQVKTYLNNIFNNYNLDSIGAVVLGCTHFIFVKNLIREILPENIEILDGNVGTVKELHRRLSKKNILNTEKVAPYISLISTSNATAEKIKLEKMFKAAFDNEDYFVLENM